MKTCPKCNTQLSDDAMFCTNCGTSFQNANPQPQQNAYQNTQQTYTQPVAPVVMSMTTLLNLMYRMYTITRFLLSFAT